MSMAKLPDGMKAPSLKADLANSYAAAIKQRSGRPEAVADNMVPKPAPASAMLQPATHVQSQCPGACPVCAGSSWLSCHAPSHCGKQAVSCSIAGSHSRSGERPLQPIPALGAALG
jgi:hypothetical protein